MHLLISSLRILKINDIITGKKIADATVDAKTGKIVLTFTKFVEEKITFQVHSSSTAVNKDIFLTMVKHQLRLLLTVIKSNGKWAP